jgi:hypothetical protein
MRTLNILLLTVLSTLMGFSYPPSLVSSRSVYSSWLYGLSSSDPTSSVPARSHAHYGSYSTVPSLPASTASAYRQHSLVSFTPPSTSHSRFSDEQLAAGTSVESGVHRIPRRLGFGFSAFHSNTLALVIGRLSGGSARQQLLSLIEKGEIYYQTGRVRLSITLLDRIAHCSVEHGLANHLRLNEQLFGTRTTTCTTADENCPATTNIHLVPPRIRIRMLFLCHGLVLDNRFGVWNESGG